MNIGRDYFRELPPLRTQRLLLRPLALADAEAIYSYASRPIVARYTNWQAHRSIAESRGFIRDMIDAASRGRPNPYAVVLGSNHQLIGTCGFDSFNEEHRRAELAYAIESEHWNNGFITEACEAIIDHAFRTLPLNRVQASCDVANLASARVMEKLGMTFEGTLRAYAHHKGVARDVSYYALLRDDWEARAADSRII